MKVRVSYHGIEVESELPDLGGEHFSDNALGKNSWKHPYPFHDDSRNTCEVAMALIDHSVKAIQKLQEGRDE